MIYFPIFLIVTVLHVAADFWGNTGIQSEKLYHYILKFKTQATFLSYRWRVFPEPELENVADCQKKKKKTNRLICVVKTSVTQLIK